MRIVSPEDQKAERRKAEPKPRERRLTSHGDLIELACEHYTTTTVQELYAVFCASPDVFMCEICGTEQSGKPVKERKPQPEDPPF